MKKTLVLVGALLLVTSIAHADKLILSLGCKDDCKAGKKVDIKATLLNDQNKPIRGQLVFMTVAAGGETVRKTSDRTNSEGNSHTFILPKQPGKGLICAVTENGAGEPLEFEVH